MKLITLNIGIKIDNSHAVSDFIKEQKPDVVAFQEIINFLPTLVGLDYY